MVAPLPLRPEDRPDFEAVLRLALDTPDIRSALRSDPTGRTARRLRAGALAHADEIAAAARHEYRGYLALRAAARRQAPPHPWAGAGPLPALAVLTPSIAGASAAALLLLGQVLRLTVPDGPTAASLITAGWVLGLIAALSAPAALVAALRGRGASAATAARLEEARLTWHRALLSHGMLPHLRRYTHAEPPAG
ncbi:hypothetical protein SZN_19390 [Streptomyces zinciresistens K42]|uniref:Transmembrane protein n=1 Tax=Streptomyces zinciresistens K42 TaxID=700597 RepID=G2GEE5_9ACTN|nr:hypothetical protein [Streptomyces zinciresistens]EGX58120.1 hypothetical protein SZN_19390 [Streptomyces zinciresistens K42]